MPPRRPPPRPPREATFQRSPLFDASLLEFAQKYQGVVAALETFQTAKRQRPPALLPRGMRDHTLGGRLEGFRECHLAGDACLIYTDKNDVVQLVIICDHDDLEGGKEKALAKQIGGLLP